MTRNRILRTAAAALAVLVATASVGYAQNAPTPQTWGPGNCPKAQMMGMSGMGMGGMGRMKMGMMGGQMGGKFGPGGPATAASGVNPPPFAEKPLTTEYVTKFVESRLTFWNNPNLAIGQVHEHDGQIQATIVTKSDGKLFRQFAFDKQTGWPVMAH
jgi:hypothetical protein